MTTRLQSKRPDEVRDHTHDWSAFLGDADTILTSSWTVSGVTKDSEEDTTTTSTVWVSGGTAGAIATLTNTIDTVGGRTETESFILPIATIDEPVSLTEAKAHLRKTDTSEDALISTFITAARQWVENYTGHVLVKRVVVDAFWEWGSYLTLRNQPITVGDPTPTLVVEYVDTNGDDLTYSGRVIRDQRYPWRIYPANGEEFPTLGTNGTITVTYTAGYDVEDVPLPLWQAMLLLIAHWHEHRGAVQDGQLAAAPLAVESLCRPYRGAVLA